jgi:Co/Zn/Cd efflux system component
METPVREMTDTLRRVVARVAVLNLGYFGIEISVALAIGSVSLFADSIDFLEDASVNFLILIALGWSQNCVCSVAEGSKADIKLGKPRRS